MHCCRPEWMLQLILNMALSMTDSMSKTIREPLNLIFILSSGNHSFLFWGRSMFLQTRNSLLRLLRSDYKSFFGDFISVEMWWFYHFPLLLVQCKAYYTLQKSWYRGKYRFNLTWGNRWPLRFELRPIKFTAGNIADKEQRGLFMAQWTVPQR